MPLTNHSSSDPPPAPLPLVAIIGPTGSGKSRLSVELAREFSGEVLACDSTQVYRGFDIGTAKPTIEERCGVPHHLLDLDDPFAPAAPFTAGEYRRRAIAVLADLARRRRLPIFTVGTGLYWRALTEGLSDAPERCGPLRARLNGLAARRGSVYLHRMLRRLDPISAARIEPQDRQKLIRAIEVCLLTGKPLTELHRVGREGLEGYAALKIGLDPPRIQLRERIERRVYAMLESGWLGEVEALVGKCAAESAKPFEFIGYRELREHLQDKKPLPEAVTAIVQATRQYAKRQLTWFRKESDVHWLRCAGDAPEALSAARLLLEQFLGGNTHLGGYDTARQSAGEHSHP